ncbi:DUF4192 domain-containing protein [Nonomuraea insulae]|uniref:DUF4192 domain-containing protein n=1 Tax=Nonomuraea insulae TaxID=1616787 RepID=A0ABW1CZG7_9ACTN
MTASVRLSKPEDFITIVPYLLGYMPTMSLVALAFDEPITRVSSVLRFDLPADSSDAPDLASQLADMLIRNNAHTTLLIGYGPGAMVTPTVDAVAHAVEARDIKITDMLRCEDSRYWSYTCPNPECCPADGTPYDIGGNPAAAEAVLAGLVARPDREEFAATLSPVTGADREQITAATRAACGRARAMLDTTHDWYGETLRRTAEALEVTRSGAPLNADQVAWLGILLTAILNRDGAMTFLGRYDDDTHVRLWTELTRRVEAAFAAAPAALLAFAAYRIGQGTLARIAVERSLAADPEYRLAMMTRFALQQAIPPAVVASDMDFGDMAEEIAAKVSARPTGARPTLPEGW